MAQGSTGNVFAAALSFFLLGVGQLTQGRIIPALFFFLLSVGLWFIFLGWLGHLAACLEAAVWKGPKP